MTTGPRPKFLDSPYFYIDMTEFIKGGNTYKLKPGAPKEVQEEYDEFISLMNRFNTKNLEIKERVSRPPNNLDSLY